MIPTVDSVKGGMAETRGGLAPARIFEADDSGDPVPGGLQVKCMFNPYEYTVSKTNAFDEQKLANGKNSPRAELSKSGAQTLKLNLIFDTYDTKEDVSKITNLLWKFMMVKDKPKPNPNDKDEVPLVAFHWGVFCFVSYITSMTHKYTLFTKEGTPVRAQVDVTFTQYVDVNDYPGQNPTSGGDAINRIWRVVGGDRLDLIAAEVYRDATKWRRIAEYNSVLNSSALKPGQLLAIPFD